MAVTANGQVEYNGLRLDGAAYELVDVAGLSDLPDIRTADATYLSRHGLHAGLDLLGGRKVTLTVAVHASTSGAFGTAVAALRTAFVAQVADLPLTFRFPGIGDSGNCFVNCRPRRMVLPMSGLWQYGFTTTAVIELFAVDPLIYGATQRNSSITINAGSTSLVNGGNWPSLFRVDIASTSTPLTNPTVQNNHLSVLKHLTLARSYNSGDLISLIPPTRKVVYDPVAGAPVDGYSALSDDSLWFELVPGSNAVVTSRTAGTGTATFYWYDSWI